MKVKEALAVLYQENDYIQVVKINHYDKGKYIAEHLYIYADMGLESPEEIYDENYAEKEVMAIKALDEGVIEIRIY